MQFEWPLIGHTRIKDYFAWAFAAGNINHAYLFEGPEQVGKATFATMLAKTLLCKKVDGPCPCNMCSACVAFDHGAHPDVLKLARPEDATSISIEATREFMHSLTTTALLGSYKVGIIEEAGLLTGEAAHALLKTLEEPARGVVIFLVSHKPLLETIASRSQRIRFGLVSVEEIMQALHDRELAELAMGRPGVAIAMQKEEGTLAEYQEKVREILAVFSRDEGRRLLWSAAQFGKGRTAALRREELREYLNVAEAVLRDSLLGSCGIEIGFVHEFAHSGIMQYVKGNTTYGIGAVLERVAVAKQYLAANVDPQLVSDYLFLGARERQILYA